MSTCLCIVCVCNTTTSPFGVSKLWGGGVTTSDRDHSVPRLSCYHYTFYYIPTAPPVSTIFLDFSISLLHPTAPAPVTIFRCIISLCCTRSPPPRLSKNAVRPNVVYTRHPPASAAWLCTPRHVPEFSDVSRVCSSHICRSRPAPRPLLDPGGFTHCGSLGLPCTSASPSMCYVPTPCLCIIGIFLVNQL